MPYSYGIVGFGIAGQLLVLELLQRKISPSEIVILDETFLGGALVTHYGSVLSNTPWWKTKKALQEYPEWSKASIEKGDKLYSENQCMPVRDIGSLCFETAYKASHAVEKITAKVLEIQQAPESKLWTLKHAFGSVSCKLLFLAPGALEKQLPIASPVIPLTHALDKEKLEKLVTKEDKVAVFGLSHSGTICLKHFQELEIQTTGIYNTPAPFLFERDGHYDGLKEGSEVIADSILKGEYNHINLVSWSNPLEIHKALKKATKIIYAIGFQQNPVGSLLLSYDSNTAALKEYSNAYGYGIAFPGMTNSKPDVSVLSFQDQIRRTLPSILQS